MLPFRRSNLDEQGPAIQENRERRKSKLTAELIIDFPKPAQAGISKAEICRKGGLSDATFRNWRLAFGGPEVSEARRLREMEAKNAKPGQLPRPAGSGRWSRAFACEARTASRCLAGGIS